MQEGFRICLETPEDGQEPRGASDELIAEAKDELAILRKKAKGRRLRKEEIDPIIADLRRLTGWSEATVVDRLNLNKKKY